MSAEEITKEIVVAMIQKGYFDECTDNHNQSTRTDERIRLISKVFREICSTVKDAR
jgi:hypothetical protein